MPNATYDVNFRLSEDNASRLAKAMKGDQHENKGSSEEV